LSWLILNAQFQPFRFALLTDTHVSRTSASALKDLQNSIDEINQTDSLDFVIVSGDLTDAGDKYSMQLVRHELDRLTIPYHVTSGNHETKWSESGCTDFDNVFGSNRFEFAHKGVYFIGFNSGPVIKMSDGHVAPQDIS
jgi:3',5'-cyclic AMP phosphodiesterase CpdA